MGRTSDFYYSKNADATREELVVELREHQADLKEHYIDDDADEGYSGTLVERNAKELEKRHDMHFTDADEAKKWLLDNDDDYRITLHAVRYTNENGKEFWIIGGWCSS